MTEHETAQAWQPDAETVRRMEQWLQNAREAAQYEADKETGLDRAFERGVAAAFEDAVAALRAGEPFKEGPMTERETTRSIARRLLQVEEFEQRFGDDCSQDMAILNFMNGLCGNGEGPGWTTERLMRNLEGGGQAVWSDTAFDLAELLRRAASGECDPPKERT